MMHSMDIDEGPLEGADDYGERLFDNTAQDLNERMDMEAIRINAEVVGIGVFGFFGCPCFIAGKCLLSNRPLPFVSPFSCE